MNNIEEQHQCPTCAGQILYCPFCGNVYKQVVSDTTSWGKCKFLCSRCGSVGIVDHYDDFEVVPADLECYRGGKSISESIQKEYGNKI